MDEPAQFLEQDAGGCALAVGFLDPVEPGQHCAGLVHVVEGSGKPHDYAPNSVFLDSVDAGLSHVR